MLLALHLLLGEEKAYWGGGVSSRIQAVEQKIEKVSARIAEHPKDKTLRKKRKKLKRDLRRLKKRRDEEALIIIMAVT